MRRKAVQDELARILDMAQQAKDRYQSRLESLRLDKAMLRRQCKHPEAARVRCPGWQSEPASEKCKDCGATL